MTVFIYISSKKNADSRQNLMWDPQNTYIWVEAKRKYVAVKK